MRLSLFETGIAACVVRLAAVTAVFVTQSDLRANGVVIVDREVEWQPGVLQDAPEIRRMLHQMVDMNPLNPAGPEEDLQDLVLMFRIERKRELIPFGEAFENRRARGERPQRQPDR